MTCTSGIVTGINLPTKSLTGNLPDALKWLVNLTSVKLNGNGFHGPLPQSWSSLTALTLLYLQSNALTGSLPAQYSNLQRLSQFYLASNQLTSTIPSVWASAGGMQVWRISKKALLVMNHFLPYRSFRYSQSLGRLVANGNTGLCGALPGNWTTAKVSVTSTLLGQDCLQTTGLLSLKSAITPASWPAGMGWASGTDPCGASWTGVSCIGPKVTDLDLSFYGLVGTLPANLSLTSGLTSLTLSGNRLVPKECHFKEKVGQVE